MDKHLEPRAIGKLAGAIAAAGLAGLSANRADAGLVIDIRPTAINGQPVNIAQSGDAAELVVLGALGGLGEVVSFDVVARVTESKKTFVPHIYDGAGHGFLRQQSERNGANEKASEQAWGETVTFLKKQLE